MAEAGAGYRGHEVDVVFERGSWCLNSWSTGWGTPRNDPAEGATHD